MGYNVKITNYGNEMQIAYYPRGVHTSVKHYMTDDEKAEYEKADKLAFYDKYYKKDCYALSEVNLLDSDFTECSIEEEVIKYVENNALYHKQHSRTASADVKDMSKFNQARSVRRSKQSIYELARANTWNYFATFTFSDSSWRYDYDTCKKKLRKWFNHFKERHVNIEYLAVPEQHKDGAWHFHALIQGDLSAYLVDFVRKGIKTLPQYKYGRNEFERVKDEKRVANYITKYVTKGLLISINHKRRYIYSKGLLKPDTYEYDISDDYSLWDFIDGNFLADYDITYQKSYFHAESVIQYIQLKKKEQIFENQEKMS